MHVHFLGQSDPYLPGVAGLAEQLGWRVSDSNDADISVLPDEPDWVVLGADIQRGHPALEYVLNRNLRYTSAGQWLFEHVLRDRWVLGVCTTSEEQSSLAPLAHILDYAGLQPGVLATTCNDLSFGRRLGQSPFFVIELVDVSSAFCDLRAAPVHFRARTLVLQQSDDVRFNRSLLTQLPGNGRVITDAGLSSNRHLNYHSEVECIGSDWQLEVNKGAGDTYQLRWQTQPAGQLLSAVVDQFGSVVVMQAIAAARHAGVATRTACEGLNQLKG